MLAKARVQAALPASDFERAKKFYSQKLQLEMAEDDPDGAVFSCGEGTNLLVYPSGFAGTNKATAAGWDVGDIEAEMAELKSRGVTFEEYDFPGLKTVGGVATLDTEKAAWFKDSEGNILGLFQRG